jgi:tripartite-type tricarboxylate transporter receptor subunit TctC
MKEKSMKKLISVFFSMLVVTSVFAEEVTTMIVPFPPGSTTDALARFNAKAMSDAGIPTVVVNRPGAGGMIALRHVADVKNKNTTLLTTSSGAVVASYMAPDAQQVSFSKDLTPITLMVADPMVIVVPANSPYKNLKDLFNDIKKRPGKVIYGAHTATSSVFVNGMLEKFNGQVLEVPYNGTGPNNVALLGNQVDFAFISYSDGKELYDAGKFRYLGVATKQRLTYSAEIPTMLEQGVNVTEADQAVVFIGVFAPAGMDSELQARINKIITSAMKSERHTYIKFKTTNVFGSSPEEFGKFMSRYKDAMQPGVEKYLKTHPR